MLQVGEALPTLHRRWARDLGRPELDRDRVLAAAARLLDLGLFRVGGEEYAEEHSTDGLATLLREHVRTRDKTVRSGYVEVSEALGNTPAVCKTSYADPRVVDLFHGGTTIALPPRERSGDAMRSALEKEALDLPRTVPD